MIHTGQSNPLRNYNKIMEKKNYVVFFKGERDWDRTQPDHVLNTEINGYYAEKQPNYRWSFTDDINKAKVYKTLNAAEKRVKHASGCSYRKLTATIIEK